MDGDRLARGWAAGSVRGDTPYEGGAEGPAGEQERPQRCARDSADDAGRLYKAVHVKTLASQQERMLLTSRKLLRDKLQDMENELRATLPNFGLRLGALSSARF